MALSSISGSAYGSSINSRSTFVPTKTTDISRAGGPITTGRGGDSYYCASCGGNKVISSVYCPTCSGGSTARTSTPHSNTQGHCPMCNKTTYYSAAAKTGVIYYHNAAGR